MSRQIIGLCYLLLVTQTSTSETQPYVDSVAQDFSSLRSHAKVQEFLKTAVSLSKFTYSKSQHNIPKEVWAPGSLVHEPLAEFENGLHAYAFYSIPKSVMYIVLRGTEIGDLDDLHQDYSLFGGRQPGHIHPWVNPGEQTAADLRKWRKEAHPNRSWIFDTVASTSYISQAMSFMVMLRRNPRYAVAKEVLFVGHSLGGTLAALLAIANSAAAVVFNAPGWYFASDWVCEKMQHFTDAAMDVDDALHMRKTTERMCAMDPAVPYPVYNVYLENDILPHTFDYGLGFSCPIPYDLVQGRAPSMDKFSRSINKLKLVNLLNVNFPSGLKSCQYFERIEGLSDIFNWAFLECFGAAHHIQVVYKLISEAVVTPDMVAQLCVPSVAYADRDRKPSKLFSSESLPLLEFISVLNRGNAIGNTLSNFIFISRTYRYTWPLWGFIPTALFALWRRRSSRMKYEKMIRMNQVSFILASMDLHNSRFSLRVLKERRLEELLFGDTHAQRLVLDAARKATKERPLLAFKEPKKDAWPIQLAVISSLYEQFADGLLQADMGLPVHSEWYTFSISCYPDEESSQKIRVYLIKMSVLAKIRDEAQLNQKQFNTWRRSRKNAWCVLKEMSRISREHHTTQELTPRSHAARGYDMPPQLGRVELTMRATYCAGCCRLQDNKAWYLDPVQGRTSLHSPRAHDASPASQDSSLHDDPDAVMRRRATSVFTSEEAGRTFSQPTPDPTSEAFPVPNQSSTPAPISCRPFSFPEGHVGLRLGVTGPHDSLMFARSSELSPADVSPALSATSLPTPNLTSLDDDSLPNLSELGQFELGGNESSQPATCDDTPSPKGMSVQGMYNTLVQRSGFAHPDT